MTVELKEPDGWFLDSASHQHTTPRYLSDACEPMPFAEGPWLVSFQKYPRGGLLTSGRGNSLQEAWEKAIRAVDREKA